MKKEIMVDDTVICLKRQSWIKSLCIYLLAFAVPFTIMCVAFAYVKIYPFGGQQVLTIDAWHQYYPFLLELKRKILGGESLLYCWRMGLGSGFSALMAYYLASPINLLFILFPQAFLKEVFALQILIKIGLAGLFCTFSLSKIFKKKEYGVVIFSTLYALCSWLLGYYWSIIWLDTFAIFPLVVAGIILLIQEKKYKLYTISLAVAIVTNYYIGLMVCIFTAIYFFAQCIICKNNKRELFENLRNIIVFSIISILMAAVAILPTIIALKRTGGQENAPVNWAAINGWFEVLANSLAYLEPTFREGLPNIYCGVVSIIFLFVFFKLKDIPNREKIVYGALLLIFYLSMNINMLNYAWHGFHNTNQMPYRYTFMFSFLLIMIAYRAYLTIKINGMSVISKAGIRFVCIAAAAYFFVAALQQMDGYFVDESVAADYTSLWVFLIKNLLIIAAYLGVLLLVIKKKIGKRVFTFVLAILVGLELVPTAIAAPKAVGTTERDVYPDRNNAVQQILGDINSEEKGSDFYRIELARRYSRNPSILYGYNGLASFTSTADNAVRQIYENMGLPVYKKAALWYYYQNSTPVNNAFLNIKYLIASGSKIANREYFTQVNSVEDVYAYRNEAYLPMGFMVENTMADFEFEGETPFEKQNNLLKAATGITEDVFEPLDIVHVGHENIDVERIDYGKYRYQPSKDADSTKNEKFKYNYEMPEDGCVYTYVNMNLNENKDAYVGIDEDTNAYEIRDACIFPAGTYEKGQVFSVKSELEAGRSGDLEVYVSMLNQDVFNKAYDILKDEVLDVTEYTSKSIKGKIAAKKDGLMYTSIPYEPGWKAYVDGKKVDIKLVGGALMAVSLAEGEHEVEFLYAPAHVYVAALLSVAGIGLFIGICIVDKKKKLFSSGNALKNPDTKRKISKNATARHK